MKILLGRLEKVAMWGDIKFQEDLLLGSLKDLDDRKRK